jgi:hypothetical protein
VEDARAQRLGNIASPFYQLFDSAGNWVWACDVDIGAEEVLRGVPVASNNREIIYAEQGRAVTLARMNHGKWVITGLAKVLKSTVHFIYLSFQRTTWRRSPRRCCGASISAPSPTANWGRWSPLTVTASCLMEFRAGFRPTEPLLK